MIGVVRHIVDGLLLKLPPLCTLCLLTTLMAKVMATINARPLISVLADPETPKVFLTAILLTQKACIVSDPFRHFDLGDLYKSQWKLVQSLTDSGGRCILHIMDKEEMKRRKTKHSRRW